VPCVNEYRNPDLSKRKPIVFASGVVDDLDATDEKTFCRCRLNKGSTIWTTEKRRIKHYHVKMGSGDAQRARNPINASIDHPLVSK
jgi:hypothetical protein